MHSYGASFVNSFLTISAPPRKSSWLHIMARPVISNSFGTTCPPQDWPCHAIKLWILPRPSQSYQPLQILCSSSIKEQAWDFGVGLYVEVYHWWKPEWSKWPLVDAKVQTDVVVSKQLSSFIDKKESIHLGEQIFWGMRDPRWGRSKSLPIQSTSHGDR